MVAAALGMAERPGRYMEAALIVNAFWRAAIDARQMLVEEANAIRASYSRKSRRLLYNCCGRLRKENKSMQLALAAMVILQRWSAGLYGCRRHRSS